MARRVEYDEWEIAFRVEETWRAFLKQRAGFFEDAEGHEPFGPPPTLTPEIRKDIVRCLKTYDSHLLAGDQREAWLEESTTRAAGIGLWFDRFMTGRHPQNDVRDGGKRYIDAWRPWKHMKGKGDPVERFAEAYFTIKAADGRKR